MRTTSLQPIHRAFAFAAALMLCTLAACATLAAVPACAFADDDVLVTSKEVADKGDDALEHTDAILYRIGNDNAVDFGTLFAELDAADVDDESVEVTVTLHTTDNGFETNDADSSLTATLTYDRSDWTNGTIQFSDHTGVVSIEISDDTSTDFTLLAEVVDGKNYFEGDIYSDTSAIEENAGKTYSKVNVVLLGDQEIYDSRYIQFSSCTVYGNGFTIDASEGVIVNGTYFGIVLLTNANLDNTCVIGPEFSRSDFGFYQSDSYSVGTVHTSGECSITNSYVSGGHCALKVESVSNTTTVQDSVFVGGNWANIEVKFGELVIEGTVTTINEANSTTGNAVGLGIVVGSLEDNPDNCYITVNGTLNQYNWVSYSGDSSYLNSTTLSYVKTAYNFFNTSGYVNMGVLFLDTDTHGSSGMPSDYTSYYGSSNILWCPTSIPSGGLDYRTSTYDWQTEAEVCYEPTYTWTYPETTDTCVYSSTNDVLTLTIGSSDSSVTLSGVTSIVSATKHGQTLSVSASASGDGAATASDDGDSLTFSDVGSYVITFTVTDALVYAATSERTGSTVTHELTLDVVVSKEATNEPTFSFVDESGTTYEATVVEDSDGDKYLTIADTSTTGDNVVSNSSVTYTDSNGETQSLMYTQVYGYMKYNSSADWTRYVPIYKGVNITYAYTDENGDEQTDTITPSTEEANSNFAMDSNYSAPTGGKGWNSYDKYNNYYCRLTEAIGTSNSAITSNITYDIPFTYTTPDTNTVYTFYVRYFYYSQDDTSSEDSEGNVYNYKKESCIPSGTQITLADGSTTAVENLTGDEELLVFDHETGAYTTSSIYALLNYGEADYEVTTLSFSDGSTTELIYEHGYFDLTRNKYVYINSGTLYDYIGDEFVVGDGESISTVTLEDVAVETRQTGCYSLITEYQLDYFVDGFLSMPGNLSLFSNIFEYGDDLAYDADLMAADIEEFGLFTYADFEDYISEEAFEALNVRYLKVAIGKGYITFDDILELVEYYSDYL